MKYAIEDRRVVCKGDYYIAPGAIVVGSVILEHNVSIWFNCVVRADNDLITLGEGSQIQDGSVLHADPGAPILFEKNVSVGHMAMIHGCTVGEARSSASARSCSITARSASTAWSAPARSFRRARSFPTAS
jgi:carbonic anhydrase/acetyltransferase-like protein (isoleucine patch superfamily)